ncbi:MULTISPECIES: DUF4123 domain-containing protein [Sorangium]|uniref:Phosphopeptide-binding protein n=1 Tax=Sorangium cellulosum TaxID=56 RepID=A0A4P2QM18_SORCE|nr:MULTISPECIES: DUF4123 domain-containing protein [Sorangium]AUX31015.1 phosphopeptide-binding protein [Sorangium cellulosum]WCQ90397.1 hypothetical protein NQZ70_03101 [Sorangium sp. Soce836]
MSEDQAAGFVLRVISGPLAGQTAHIPGDRPLLVGRAPESDLSISSDGELSALHFSVEQIDGSYLLRDLGSRNGTQVNRERAREVSLRDGDEIRAGATLFAVVRHEPSRRYAPTEPAPPSRRARTEPVPSSRRARTEPVPSSRRARTEPAPPSRRPRRTGIPATGSPFTASARARLRQERSPLFAVVDAARDPRIRLLLGEAGEQTASLYTGFQGEILADVGPTLVHLPPGSTLLDALVDCGWGDSWGVFLTSNRPFGDVRKHLRRFLLVESGTGKQQYFRFYDPRVLRGFLPTCGPRKVEALFEEIEAFAMEAEDPGKLLRFTAQGGKAIREESALERGS